MATISMSTNSASTSNNGGTGNKQLRGSLVTLQNDIDLADAILQNGGTALAANDIIEAIAVPAKHFDPTCRFRSSNCNGRYYYRLFDPRWYHRNRRRYFATAFDLDGASVGDHTPAITSSGCMF